MQNNLTETKEKDLSFYNNRIEDIYEKEINKTRKDNLGLTPLIQGLNSRKSFRNISKQILNNELDYLEINKFLDKSSILIKKNNLTLLKSNLSYSSYSIKKNWKFFKNFHKNKEIQVLKTNQVDLSFSYLLQLKKESIYFLFEKNVLNKKYGRLLIKRTKVDSLDFKKFI